MKSYVNKFIIAAGIFFMFFKSVDVSSFTYALIFTVAWGLIITNFWLYKNQTFYNSLISINLGIFVSYIVCKWINPKSKIEVYQDVWIWAVALAILLSFCYKCLLIFRKQRESEHLDEPIIFPKRKKDLENILYYIDFVDIVGINSKWGTGKTFIVDNFKKQLRDQYEIIEIDLLACNFKEMQAILISALEDVLYKNGIVPKYANKIKSNLANTSALSKFQDLSNLFLNNSTRNSELFLEFKNELRKIDKKILLIFEDIDRISDKSVITDVFAIAEKLAHNNLKVVYQYDEEILINLEYDNKFLEKYIPFKVNLTDLHAKEIINFELENDENLKLTIEDCNFLWAQENRFKHRHFTENAEYTFKIDYFSIRVIKNMLIELNMALQDNKVLYEFEKEFKEVIIGYYVLKHLYPDCYNKININEGLLGSLKFNVNETGENEKKSIKDFIHDCNSNKLKKAGFKKIINTNENIDIYRILKLFNYKFVEREPSDYMDDHQYFKLLSEANYYNEKTDRIIRNLMHRGTSVLTDMEYAVKKLVEEVLEKDIKNSVEQKVAFESFINQLNYLDPIKDDQTTISKIGVPITPFIFKAFEIVNKDTKMQLKLIDFYFNCLEVEELNMDVLKCLNYCPLDTKTEYLKIVDYVNNLKVVDNFENSQEFLTFLKKYMQAFSQLSIKNNIIEYFDDYSKFQNIDDQKELFKKFKDEFEGFKKMYKQKGLESYNKDLDTIIRFFEKLSEIVHHEKIKKTSYSYSNMGGQLTVSRDNLIVFDKFHKKLNENDNSEETYKEIDEAYKNGELTFYHLTILLSIEPNTEEYLSNESLKI